MKAKPSAETRRDGMGNGWRSCFICFAECLELKSEKCCPVSGCGDERGAVEGPS